MGDLRRSSKSNSVPFPLLEGFEWTLNNLRAPCEPWILKFNLLYWRLANEHDCRERWKNNSFVRERIMCFSGVEHQGETMRYEIAKIRTRSWIKRTQNTCKYLSNAMVLRYKLRLFSPAQVVSELFWLQIVQLRSDESWHCSDSNAWSLRFYFSNGFRMSKCHLNNNTTARTISSTS